MRNAPSTRKNFSRRALLKKGTTFAVAAVSAPFVLNSTARADTLNIRLGSDSPGADAHSYAMVRFGEELEARTDGRITSTFFPDAQLGGNEVMMNSLKAGVLDGMMSNLGVLTTAVPEVEILTLPFLFNDTRHALRSLHGEIGSILTPRIEEGFNCRVVGWGSDGTRLMWNNKRPITKPEDVAGLKMRVQPAKTHQDTYSALGALPTVVPFSELYTALQTGVVDGADVGLVDILSLKFYQVTKYVSFTNHVSILDSLLVSNSFWNKLSPEDQQIVLEAGDTAGKAQVEKTLGIEEGAVPELEEKGLVFNQVESQAAFAEKMTPVYDSMLERVPEGANLIKIAKATA